MLNVVSIVDLILFLRVSFDLRSYRIPAFSLDLSLCVLLNSFFILTIYRLGLRMSMFLEYSVI